MSVTPPLAFGLRLTFALAVCALIGGLAATRAAAEPPPEMMNYQGQLTDTSGTPITTPQTVFFSLWKNGDEATADSGTELFRESATVTPSATGVFAHQIGTGTLEAGALDPSDFRVADPIFLQVAVGSLSGVLLPRSRIVSVGYSFVADYANTAGAITGLPEVTGVVDTTGGLTVVGDLLRIDGDGLSEAEVLIGGKPARVKSRTDTAIECQVPTGLPRGLNRVAVVEAETGKASNTRFHVDVHRLIVGVFGRSGSDRIFVIDANTGDLLASFDPDSIEDTLPPMQMDFAHEGALALIPANTTNGELFAIDLTDDPPDLVDTFTPTGGSRCASVAVSPDNLAVVTSHPDNHRLRAFGFGQDFPPYSSSVLDGSTDEIEGPASSSTYSPRGCTFIGNGLLLVCASGNGSVLGYRRDPGTLDFEDDAWEITEVAAGTAPFAITRTPDQSRGLITNQSSANLRASYVSSVGLGTVVGSATGGPFALRMTVSPDSRTVMVADQAGSQPAEQGSLQRGLVNIFGLSGSSDLRNAGTYGYADYEAPNDDITRIDEDDLLQLIAIDPVDGDLAAVGIQTGSVRLYERTGGALAFVQAVGIQGGSTSNGQMLEMQFQP